MQVLRQLLQIDKYTAQLTDLKEQITFTKSLQSSQITDKICRSTAFFVSN